jgi:ABC-2 type transport system permease protein
MIEPIVYLNVWTTVTRARGGDVNGFSAGDFAAYYLVFLLIRQMTIAPSAMRLERYIRTGEMSSMLIRPMHPIHWDMAEITAQKIFALPQLIALMLLIAVTFSVRVDTPLWAWLAFVPVVIMAGFLRFFTQWTVALTAFWTTRVEAVWTMYLLFQTFLGGFLAPLPLLPAPLQALATLLPFRWIFTFPIEVALGKLTPEQTLVYSVIQTVWVIAGWLIMRFVWQASVQHYAAVGG